MDDDDSFFSDEDDKTKRAAPPMNDLGPIVKVPSEAGSLTDTARSDFSSDHGEASSNHEDASSHQDSEEARNSDEADEGIESEEEEETPRPRRRVKGKTRNGRVPIDMTPPDKLLKRSESCARKYAERGKETKAIRELIRCTALARIVHGDGHWKLAKAHVDLARGYLDLKTYAVQAQYHTDIARGVFTNSVTMATGTDRPLVMGVQLNLYYVQGRALAQLKKYSEAEQALGRAERIAGDRAKLSSVTDNDLDKWDFDLYLAEARLYGRQQKHAVAQEYFDKVLDVGEKLYSRDGIELIPVYQGMGRLEQSKGKHAEHEKAIENFLQAHSIASARYKDGSEKVADTAYSLAVAYTNVGQDDADVSAESYFNDCLAIRQVSLGPSHPQTLMVQDDLARLMIRTQRHQEGLDLLRTTLELKKETKGDFSTEVAETLKLMGNVHLAQGSSDKALRCLKKCHTAEVALYGQNHKKSKDTQRSIDLLMANPTLASKHKNTKAEELKNRPRFNSIVNRTGSIGAPKPI